MRLREVSYKVQYHSVWEYLNARGYSREFLLGMCRPILLILTPFSELASKIHTHSQTCPLRNLCHNYLDQNSSKKDFLKAISNWHISLSLLLIWNWNNKYFRTLSKFPGKPYPIFDSGPKWGKCIPVFRPERRKNPTLWGGTYLYGLYRGVPPGLEWHLPAQTVLRSFETTQSKVNKKMARKEILHHVLTNMLDLW